MEKLGHTHRLMIHLLDLCQMILALQLAPPFFQYVNEENCQKKKCIHNFFGPEYSNSQIKSELEISKIKFEELTYLEEDAAKRLSEGKIIGWFQGKSELGQRSLGNRSILASPTFGWMKDHINKFIKFRENFRNEIKGDEFATG